MAYSIHVYYLAILLRFNTQIEILNAHWNSTIRGDCLLVFFLLLFTQIIESLRCFRISIHLIHKSSATFRISCVTLCAQRFVSVAVAVAE